MLYTDDASPNGNDLTNNNGVSEYTASLPFGQSHAAADFDASLSQYLEILDANQTGLDLQDLTFEADIRLGALPSTAGINMVIMAKDDVGVDRSFALLVQGADDKLLLATFGSGSTSTRATMDEAFVSGDVGSWIHIAAKIDVSASAIVFLKNGTVKAGTHIAATATDIVNSSTPFTVGCRRNSGTPGEFFHGQMDNLRCWATLRSTAEVNDNRSLELTGSETGLMAYWPFEEQLGTVLLTLTETINMSSSIVKATTKVVSNTLNAAEQLLKSVSRSISDAVNGSDSIALLKGIVFSDSLNVVDLGFTVVASYVRVLQDTLNTTDTVIRAIYRSFSDSLIKSSVLAILGAVSKTLTLVYNIFAFVLGLRAKPAVLRAKSDAPNIMQVTSGAPDVLNARGDAPTLFSAKQE